MQDYRKAAEAAKWRKGKWIADEILLFSAFLRVLCGFAVTFWRYLRCQTQCARVLLLKRKTLLLNSRYYPQRLPPH